MQIGCLTQNYRRMKDGNKVLPQKIRLKGGMLKVSSFFVIRMDKM